MCVSAESIREKEWACSPVAAGLRYYLFAKKKKARLRSKTGFRIGGNAGIRTLDRRIKSPLLYQLSYVPEDKHQACSTSSNCGGNAGIRTLDRRIKSPLLYQLSYVPELSTNSLSVVGRAGLEPTTNGLKVRCSTN